ncbi:MAG: hypothetical protein WAM14_01230 [Candidatus Nitrosopolaris sp.]
MLEHWVKQCLPLPNKFYRCTRRLRTIEEVEECFREFKAFIATQQEIPRPTKNKIRTITQVRKRNIL